MINEVRKIPKLILFFIILTFIIPIFFDLFISPPFDDIWPIHIVTLSLVTFYVGFLGGGIMFFLSSIFHILWEWAEFTTGVIGNDGIGEITISILINLFLVIGLGIYSTRNKKSRDELLSILDNQNVAIWIYDIERDHLTVSKGLANLFGFSMEEVKSNPVFWKNYMVNQDESESQEVRRQLTNGIPNRSQFQIQGQNGEIRWLESLATPEYKNGRITQYKGIVKDITERKNVETHLQQITYLDTLTGLPNRHAANEQLDNMIKNADEQVLIAVYMLDLDNFKQVNDTLGHSLGDELLKSVGNRIKAILPIEVVFYRLGGDEYMLIFKCNNQDEAERFAKKLLAQFRRPHLVRGQEVFTSASIGIALFPYCGLNGEEIVKHADSAMFMAKEKGKNKYQFYSLDNANVNHRKAVIENKLHHAIQNNELHLVYQPKINMFSNQVVGVEALLRWENSELGLVPPNEFIPIAEDNGLIVSIGNWVIREACRQNAAWQFLGLQPLQISLNVSVKQFQHSSLVKVLKDAIAENNLLPHLIELEITESTMQNFEESIKVIQELKEIGVCIAIDDFGTGYSSLSVLKNLNIDTLKIDKSFIADMLINPNTASLTKTIIDMGKNIKSTVVAEGIEQIEQANYLMNCGCYVAQGFFYSKPIKSEDFIKKYAFILETT